MTKIMNVDEEMLALIPLSYNKIVGENEVAKMQSEFLSLKVDGIKDKAGLLKVEEAHKKVKSTCADIEKTRKGLKEAALVYGREVDGQAKKLMAMLEPIRDHLGAERDRIEKEKEEVKHEAERKAQAELQKRVDTLESLGMAFNGVQWVFVGDSMSITVQQVKEMSNIAFEHFCNEAKVVFEKLAADKIEKEKTEQIEKERLERIKQEQEAEQAKLDAIKAEQEKQLAKIKQEQEEIERQQKELAQKKIKSRQVLLESIGMIGSNAVGEYSFREIHISYQDIIEFSDEKFDKIVAAFLAQIKSIRQEEERQENDRKEAQRKEQEEKAKAQAQKELDEKLAKEAKDKEDAEKEAQRLELLKPDSAKLLELTTYLKGIDISLSTVEGAEIFKTAKHKIEGVVLYIENEIKLINKK